MSIPLEAMRLEADVQSYPTYSKCLILKAKEKALRSIDDHPKRIALDVKISQRLQNRSSFRRKAEELSTLLSSDLKHRRTSFISYLHRGNKAPLLKNELPPLFLESLVELMTLTYGANAASPPLLHIRLTILSKPMDPLVTERETAV